MAVNSNSPPSGYYQKFTDAFTRADETPIASPWTSYPGGGSFNPANLTSGEVEGSVVYTGALAMRNGGGISGSADQYSEVKLNSVGVYKDAGGSDWMGPAVRVQTSEITFYTARFFTPTVGSSTDIHYDAYKALDDSWTQIKANTHFRTGSVAGYWFGLKVLDDDLTIYYYPDDTTTPTTITTILNDATITDAGYNGFYCQICDTASHGAVTEWVGGDTVAPATPRLIGSRGRIVNAGGFGGNTKGFLVNLGG